MHLTLDFCIICIILAHVSPLWNKSSDNIEEYITSIKCSAIILILFIHAAAILKWKRGSQRIAKDAAMEVSKLETKKWSQNLSLVPPISQDIIDNWADSVARIPRAKQSKGYSNFIEGYIHDVEGMWKHSVIDLSIQYT